MSETIANIFKTVVDYINTSNMIKNIKLDVKSELKYQIPDESVDIDTFEKFDTDFREFLLSPYAD